MIPQNARKGNGKKGRMKNWQLFKSWNEACNYYLDHLTPNLAWSYYSISQKAAWKEN